MSSSKSREGSPGNTNEDDNEDKNELEYDNEAAPKSKEANRTCTRTNYAHAAEKDEEQSGERRAQHPPGVCSRPHLREQQRRLAKHARYLLSMLTHAQWGCLPRLLTPLRRCQSREPPLAYLQTSKISHHCFTPVDDGRSGVEDWQR